MRWRVPLRLAVPAVLAAGVIALAIGPHGPAAPDGSADNVPAHKILLPMKEGSVRFAAIGDMGTGEKPQYETAAELARYHQTFPFDFVLMLGDNLYGGSKPEDYEKKFSQPYKPLLDAGVKFYGSLGNHDRADERFFAPFNMGGQRYYNFKKGNVAFFALDSNYMDPPQVDWLDRRLQEAGNGWKICFFHHPLYSDGKFHGPDLDLRQRIEPLFLKDSVNLVLSGHDHVYERIAPQHGIYYFVMGCSGELRNHDLRPSAATQKGFDTDRAFLLFEISGDQAYFQAVSREGLTVDSGMLQRQGTNPAP